MHNTSFQRAVVLAAGSGGDVAPFATVAARLAARGLATTLLAPVRYRRYVPAGVAFQSIGADDVFERVFDGSALWHAATGFKESWRYYGAAMRSALPILRSGWSARDTLLVSSSFAVAARLAEELDGFRNTTVHLSPSVIFSRSAPPVWPGPSIQPHWPAWAKRLAVGMAERLGTDPVIGAQVNRYRRELDLPAARRLFSTWIHSPRRVVYAFPAWFAPAADDWPAQGRYAGFPVTGIETGQAMPVPLTEFLAATSGPLAVITAGTAVADRPAWVERMAAQAVAAGGRALIIRPGAVERDGAVLALPFAPFGPLLRHAAVLVHHAGIGTMAAGLRAGLPQIVFPSAHDQPDNADRLHRLGLAQVLALRADDTELAAAWRWALDPSTRNSAKSASSRMTSDAADTIADLAAT